MPANQPNRPVTRRDQIDEGQDKPYELVSFPKNRPSLKAPAGHHRFNPNCYHGTLFLTLTAVTSLHVSTGVTALGKDIDERSRIPLIKTMVRNGDKHLTIQGSSLKGCVRAIYEAITNSTLAVISHRYRQKMPNERLPCRSKVKLCPASQVFGALDWQGLVHFTDATCDSTTPSIGFMPSLYRPRPDERDAYFINELAAGRKFYRHAVRAANAGDQGIPVQQAGTAYIFKTKLHFHNLSQAQLGTLLIALGQDSKYQMSLKLGGGKPVGMGTVKVEVSALDITKNVRDRYTSYSPQDSSTLTGEKAATFIQQAADEAKNSKLVELPQLKTLAQILNPDTDYQAPEGMY